MADNHIKKLPRLWGLSKPQTVWTRLSRQEYNLYHPVWWKTTTGNTLSIQNTLVFVLFLFPSHILYQLDHWFSGKQLKRDKKKKKKWC